MGQCVSPFCGVQAAAPQVESVACTRVYNMMQDPRSLWMIVDARGDDATHAGDVDSAVGVATSAGAARTQILERFSDINVQSGSALAFTLCICCGGVEGSLSMPCAQQVDRALQKISQRYHAAARGTGFEIAKAVAFSYDGFRAAFPYACSDFPGFEATRVYPSWVDQRVFLCHWAVAADAFVVRTCLHSTHVVNCTPHHACCFEGEGVQYFRVPVPDEASAQILPYLEPAVAFISGALANPDAVVVVLAAALPCLLRGSWRPVIGTSNKASTT